MQQVRARSLDEDETPVAQAARSRAPLFAPLPVRGPWTPLHLTRAQFVAILTLACLVYAFLGGPLWRHLGEGDFARIVVSYAVIPLGVAAALARNRELRFGLWLGASAVLAALKLILTATLALVLGIAASP
ncbi:MAG TPA: hypothetical protein VIS07_01020 [Candidatus Binatia bacterium]